MHSPTQYNPHLPTYANRSSHQPYYNARSPSPVYQTVQQPQSYNSYGNNSPLSLNINRNLFQDNQNSNMTSDYNNRTVPMSRQIRNRAYDDGSYQNDNRRAITPNKPGFPLSYQLGNYPGLERNRSPQRNRVNQDLDTPNVKTIDYDNVCKPQIFFKKNLNFNFNYV